MNSLGGTQLKTNYLAVAAAAGLLFGQSAVAVQSDPSGGAFQRIATYPTFITTGDIDNESAPEIVDATADGNTLIYTDSPQEAIGIVDITNPGAPAPVGLVALEGEPTSVAVKDGYALAAVNTSLDFINVSGLLQVVDIASQTIVRSINLDGQPDAIDVSPDGRYAAIAIENERDEDLGDGEPPQAPAGFLTIVDLAGSVDKWSTRKVELAGIADLFPDDPEPEYVDINASNIAVVSFQENNHLALVDLETGKVVNDFSAGAVDLEQIDITEEDVITLTDSLEQVAREPDGVAWISESAFATADEGDLFGGSRGFTIFDNEGETRFEAGNSVDHATVRIGHYPEDRSGNKGNEPENVEYGIFGNQRTLFVGSERSSVVLVYRLGGGKRPAPRLRQILPANIGPEGLLAIPQRGLFIAASEEDARDDKFRGSLNIYQWQDGAPSYPTLVSINDAAGTPIPWGAQSALAASVRNPDLVFSVHDSFYRKSRIFAIKINQFPARIVRDVELVDTNGAIAAIEAEASAYVADNGLSDQVDGIKSLVNEDGSVNLDLEGIAVRADGGFIVASEGSGAIGDGGRAFSPNLVAWVDRQGNVERAVTLPGALANAGQRRFGLEGVTIANGSVYVAFQRAWPDAGDPGEYARIGRLDGKGDWRFAYYPLDAVESPNGGWIGLSEIAAIGKDAFLVVERDNQGGPDARVKRVYEVSTAGVKFAPDGEPFPILEKSLVRDLMPDLAAPGGAIIEKVEGLTQLANGDLLISTDNDGVDDSSGETQLIRITP